MQLRTSFTSNYLKFTNNFYAEWQITPAWKATMRLGISQQRDRADDFYPVNHSMFKNYTDESTLLKRGKYILENGESNSISSDLNLNYNKLIGKHTIFANAGFFISEDKSSAYQHTAEGFGNNQIADITFCTAIRRRHYSNRILQHKPTSKFLIGGILRLRQFVIWQMQLFEKALLLFMVQITVGLTAGLLV